MSAADAAQRKLDRAELKKKKVEPCHTCGGRIHRAIEGGKRFNRTDPRMVLSHCCGCQGFGSPELIPDEMIRKIDWPFTIADHRDAAVIRRRRAELVDRREEGR